jgi:putative membrane protein
MFPHLGAFLVSLAATASVMMLAVGMVSPRNPRNTFGRAIVVALILSLAWYVTLAPVLWWLLIPLLLYVIICLVTIMTAYGIGFFQALLFGLAFSFLGWVVHFLFGIQKL